jgi:PRTRC genetic system ParB family protein
MPKSSDAVFANIELARLFPAEQNARKFKDDASHRVTKFNELVASVREKGIIEPLVVRPTGDGNYEIIAGERRYRAAMAIAAETNIISIDYEVPCMVRDVDDAEASDLAIIENLQREDLTPFEAASAFKSYLDQFGNTPESVSDLASRTGLPAHAIRRQVRMLDLPTEILNVWGDGTITAGHVEAFTRIDDRELILQVLTECLRRKLSVRELREHINGISPDLESGFFDQGECQTCPSNTSLQSGLFAEIETDGKCINPACFMKKQGAFLTENWSQSKAAEKFGTRGFRFGGQLRQENMEMITTPEPAERCLSCDAFVSLLRISGMIVGGYARTCVGSRECFEELYRQSPPPSEEPEPEEKTTLTEDPAEQAGPTDPTSATQPSSDRKTTPAPEETGPVFSARRAEMFREKFLSVALPAKIAETPASQAQSLRLVALALALASPAAKTHLVASLGSNDTPEDLAAKVFEIPAEDIHDQLQQLAVAQVMSSSYNGTLPSVRKVVAERFGIELHREWFMTEDYLKDLKKSEIVRVGEEPQVSLWGNEKVDAYRQENCPGKALMSLRKEVLIDLVIKSGIDLVGLVPNEIMDKKG